MRLIRTIGEETLRALSVLALVFLAFAQQPLAYERYGVSTAVSAAVHCGAGLTGDPSDDRTRAKKPRDVLRTVMAIDLPALPAALSPVLRPLGCGTARLPVANTTIAPFLAGGGPRAPPFSVPA